MRRLLTILMVLVLALPCSGAQWFADATDGSDAYDGKQTAVTTTPKTGCQLTQADTAIGSAMILTKAGAFGSPTSASKVGKVYYLEDEGDAGDFGWMMVTNHVSYSEVQGTVFGQVSTLEAVEATVKTGQGPVQTVAAALVAAQSDGDHTIWFADGTYTNTTAMDDVGSSNVSASRTLTIRSLLGNRASVLFVYNDATADHYGWETTFAAGTFTMQDVSIDNQSATGTGVFLLAHTGGDVTFDNVHIFATATLAHTVDSDNAPLDARTMTYQDCTIDSSNSQTLFVQSFGSYSLIDSEITTVNRTPGLCHIKIDEDVIELILDNVTCNLSVAKPMIYPYPTAPGTDGSGILVKNSTLSGPIILLDTAGVTAPGDVPNRYRFERNTLSQTTGGAQPAIRVGPADPTDTSDIWGSFVFYGNICTQASGVTKPFLQVGGDVAPVDVSHNTFLIAGSQGVDLRTPNANVASNSFSGANLLSLVGVEAASVMNNSFYVGAAGYGFRVTDDSENTTYGVVVPEGHTFRRNILHVNHASAYGLQLEHGANPIDFICDDNLYYIEAGKIGRFARFETTDATYDEAPTPTVTKAAAYTDYTWASGDVWVMNRPSADTETVASRTDADNIVLSAALGTGDLVGTVYSYIVVEKTSLAELQAFWPTLGNYGIGRFNDRSSASANPRFVNPTAGDLRIGGSSPARGTQTGTPNLATWNAIGAWQRRAGGSLFITHD